MKRNRLRQSICLIVVLSQLLAGCGGNAAYRSNVSRDRGTAVNHTVSGGAVSEDKKYCFRTDTNVYYETTSGIRQKRLDGTHDKKILSAGEDETYLYYVDENWLYYEIEKFEYFSAYSVLYRVPIEKDAKGYDVVNESEKEVLLNEPEPGFKTSYWDSRYMIYRAAGERIVTYDLQKKEMCSETGVAEFGADSETKFWFLRLEDYFVALAGQSVYVQKPGETGWKKCEGDNWKVSDIMVAQSEKNLFFALKNKGGNTNLTDIQVRKCDGKTVEEFVTETQIERAVREAKEMGEQDKPDAFKLDRIFMQDGRLYMQLELGWYDDKKYRMEYVLFSRGEDETELRYERELTECMQSHGTSRTGSWKSKEDDRVLTKETVVMNDAQCVYMMNGHVYFSLYDYEKNRGQMGCYELHTGKFRWVTEEEAEDGELSWEGAYDYEDLEEVFGDDMLNPYTGFSIGPVGEGRGYYAAK